MKYSFEEQGHKHFLYGKRATGVTTILGCIAKPFLIPWAAKMASEYVLKNLKDLNQLKQVCEEAKNAHRRKKEDAGTSGTNIHKIIEDILKDAIKIDGMIPATLENDLPQVKHFINWAVKNNVKFLESEKSVWSEKLFCAGICDFVCEINGEKLVGDLKTSKSIYPEYLYQVGAYRMFLQEMGEKNFKGSVIVRLGKNGKFNEDEDVVVSYGYEEEKEAFLAALKLYRIGNNFKTKNKYSKAL